MNFADRLAEAAQQKKTPLVVGLDPRVSELPKAIHEKVDSTRANSQLGRTAAEYEEFCKSIIDVVAPLVPAVKPQMAFFEELGPAGMMALSNVIDHAVLRDMLVILDGKRNDIGSTGQAYASAYLGRKPTSAWGADALTVNPWMGYDTLEPFYETAVAKGAGIFVLVKTSNPGSAALQEQEPVGGRLYHQVARHLQSLCEQSLGACGYGIAGAVVGATYPAQLAELRGLMPQAWFLVPGFGAQGGKANDVAAAFDAKGLGAIINSSRGIIFAHKNPAYSSATSWEHAVELATRQAMDDLRAATPAAHLI